MFVILINKFYRRIFLILYDNKEIIKIILYGIKVKKAELAVYYFFLKAICAYNKGLEMETIIKRHKVFVSGILPVFNNNIFGIKKACNFV